MTEEQILQYVWQVYRQAMVEHIHREAAERDISLHMGDTDDSYRERAEKAGLVRVINFVMQVAKQ